MSWIEKRLARQIRYGTLELRTPSGEPRIYGTGDSPRAVIHIHNPRFFRRVAADPEFMLGQTYMDGDWSVGDGGLIRVLDVLLNNFPPLSRQGIKGWLGWVARPLQQWNRANAARRNIASHYDLEDWLFRHFLDRDMHYSCAYFRDSSMDLESAQDAKAAHIRKKLLLRPGDRILDIGCGWGSMAIHLAQHEPVHVVGLTLSEEQQRLAQQRVQDAGVADQVEIRLQDYREVEGPFDRIVSVGMFEHVGTPFYETYFDTVRRLLTEDGIALIHTIGKFTPPGLTNPWIRRYIFPGGYIPSTSEVMTAIENVGIRPADIEILRLHYAYTLASWQARFQRVREQVAARKGESFCRMWEFYLAVSEAAFYWRGMMVLQLQLARQQDAVPWTRDYLYSDGGTAQAPQRKAS